MTGYLTKAVMEELGKSLKRKSEKTLKMSVRFDNIFYPILKFSEKSFSIQASHKVKLRGLVDIFLNNKHTYQALIIASESRGDVIDFTFKRNTVAQSTPALDFEKQDKAVVALLTEY